MNYILIAHEPATMRYGLSQIISMLPAPVTVLMVGTTDEVISAMQKQPFDLLILSCHIGGNTTAFLMNMVRMQYPLTRILLFSTREDSTIDIGSLPGAADGYLSKNPTEEETQHTIATLLNSGKETATYSLRFSNPLAQLSSREIEVMNLLAKGIPLQKIAAQLALHLTTVSTYKTRIFKKLDINSIVELLEKIRIYGTRKAV